MTGSDYRGMRVTVMGLGSFGGGLGAARFLVERGAVVTVSDLRSEAQLAESLAELADCPPAHLHLGGHQPADFIETDLVVVNPAVPHSCPYRNLAIAHEIPLTSEIELFWQHNPAPIIAITGSNGKSTTTALTHALLAATGRKTWLGGNIGRSLLPIVDQISPADWVVLELSSFQLEDLDRRQVSPHVAIVTNLTPNHLDRHHTLEAYRTAKQTILRYQQPSNLAILNADDPDVVRWPTRGRTLWFGLQSPPDRTQGMFWTGTRAEAATGGGTAEFRDSHRTESLPLRDWLTLPGRHNLQNALAATTCALALGATPTQIETGLRGFIPLPHRLELVADIAGRRFFNDSLATTPESVEVALDAFADPIILLAGGYDKGSDLTNLACTIAEKPVKAVALMGKTGPILGEKIRQFDPAGRIALHRAADFADAFQWSAAQSAPGDVVLLSPACASYDWFRNFAERGTRFRELARDWQPDDSLPQ